MKDKKTAVLVLISAALLGAAVLFSTGCGKNSPGKNADASEKNVQDSRNAGGEEDPGYSTGNTDTDSKDKSLLFEGSPGKSEKNTENLPEEISSEEKARITAPENLHVGDVLEDGNLRIAYTASGIYEEENEYQYPESGYRYIFLRFCFENTAENEDLSIPLFNFACYADSYEAEGFYGGKNDLASFLSAGRTATGDLFFQVPENAENIEVEYRPKYVDREALPLSGKVRFLYEGEQDSGFTPPVLSGRTKGALDVGSTAQTKKERVTFLSCETDDTDNEYLSPAQGCTWYTLSFEVENVQVIESAEDDAELAVSAYDFSCYADGAACRSTYFRDDYLSSDLDPGRRAKGTVTFEVPDGAAAVEVEYRPADRSAEKIVFTVR